MVPINQWVDKKAGMLVISLLFFVALGSVLLKLSGLNTGKNLLSDRQLIEQGLAHKTQEENSHLPMMLDRSTRLDRVGSNGMEYIYFLSVVGTAAERFKDDVNTGRLKRKHQNAKWSLCESADMAPLLQAGVRLTYQYSVAGARNIAAVTVDKSDCV